MSQWQHSRFCHCLPSHRKLDFPQIELSPFRMAVLACLLQGAVWHSVTGFRDLRFSRWRRQWNFLSSWMLRRAFWYKRTDVSGDSAAVMKLFIRSVGVVGVIWNVGKVYQIIRCHMQLSAVVLASVVCQRSVQLLSVVGITVEDKLELKLCYVIFVKKLRADWRRECLLSLGAEHLGFQFAI